MHVTGIPANLLSLGALDFGIIVDGTLIMVEHIVHALDGAATRSTRDSVLDTIRDAALEVERPIFFSLLIIVSAYIPLFTLERVERRLFTPMAFTVCYALLRIDAARADADPGAGHLPVPQGAEDLGQPAARLAVGPLRARAARRRSRTPRAWSRRAAVVVAGALVLSTFLGTEFLPQLDEGVIWIRANFPAGISLAKSAELAGEIRRLVKQSPEVREVASQTGRNDAGTDPYGPNRNELFVALTPYDTWPRGKVKADSRRGTVAAPEGRDSRRVLQLHAADHRQRHRGGHRLAGRPRRHHHGPGPGRPAPARHADARTSCATCPGAADTGIEQEEDQAQLRLRLDRQALARYGINVRDVQDVIELAIGGRTVSTFFEGERRFDITVRYVPEARTDPSAIGSILVTTRDGGRVPLSQLADIHVANGASIIARRENRRQISVRTNIRGRDQGGFVADAQQRFARAVTLPDGLPRRLGRPVREPDARAAAARVHPAGHHRGDLRAAVLHLRLDDRTPGSCC